MSTATPHPFLKRDPVRIQVDCPVMLKDESTGYAGEGRCLYLSTHSMVFTANYMPLMGTRLFVQVMPKRAVTLPLDAQVVVRRVESAPEGSVYRITATIETIVR